MAKLNSNQRIAKNSLYLSIRMVLVLFIGLYTTRAVLRILGVEDYGVYNVVCGFVAMFAFLNTSMSHGIQRFFNFELGKNGEEGANQVFNTAIIIQVILSVIVILLSETLGLWYLHNKMVLPESRMYAAEWIFQFSVIGFFFVIMQAPFTAAVMAHEKMDFFALVSILDVLLKLGIVFLLEVLDGDHLIWYGALYALISVINYCLYYIFCKKNFKEIYINIAKKQKGSKSLFGAMLSFSGWNIFGSFSQTMRDQGINLILNLFFGPVVNASRGVAVQINTAVTNLVTSILTPVRPQVIQSYARNEINRVMNLTYSISKFSLSFLFILVFPICLEINYILKIWLGDSVPYYTAIFSIIILATDFMLVPMNALATLVHASGQMRNYQVIGSFVKILSVPVSYLMLKIGYAPYWALIMVLLFDGLGLIVGMFIIKTLMPFRIVEYFKKVVIPLIPVIGITCLAVLPVNYIMRECFLRLLIEILIITILVLIVLYFISMSIQEKNVVKALVMKPFNKNKNNNN